MTAAIVDRYDPPAAWTDDALEQIPEGVHYEIEDGHLIVSPRPSLWHQEVCHKLVHLFTTLCPPGWWPVQEGEIRVYDGPRINQLRAPDVMLVPRALVSPDAIRGWVHPHEIPLAIEVTSPSSATSDAYTKRGVYAEWGIPMYLRLGLQLPATAHVYRLGNDKAYLPPTRHQGTLSLDDPFPIELDLDSIRVPGDDDSGTP